MQATYELNWDSCLYRYFYSFCCENRRKTHFQSRSLLYEDNVYKLARNSVVQAEHETQSPAYVYISINMCVYDRHTHWIDTEEVFDGLETIKWIHRITTVRMKCIPTIWIEHLTFKGSTDTASHTSLFITVPVCSSEHDVTYTMPEVSLGLRNPRKRYM